ncbi:MAG: hypothetical protein K2P94_05060 [Rhodospirillaceae bacterium]|nr:hypothetical protein [Rhodospirillaceae bacterium]
MFDSTQSGARTRRGAKAALSLATSLIALTGVWASAQAAETRSFVVSYFYDANYSDGKTDCPNGMNMSSIDFYRRDLLRVGLSKEKVEEALKDFPGEGGLSQPWVPLVMTRGNGKDNVYTNPETAPDPGLITVSGKHSYGFNLDGKSGKNDFIEPDTKQTGIDNQMYRVMGCVRSYRGLPPPGRPSLVENLWDVLRDVAPAWIISVSSQDSLSKDGDVTITFTRALERITRDASGAAAQADMTYQMDPDKRSHNVMKGKIKNGVVTVDKPHEFHMIFDPYMMAEYNLTKAQMRLELKADGTARGYIGGYLPWRDFFYSIANQGHIKEYATSIDVPGLYYALKRNADADPDPKTKENRRISAAYQIEAVRAFVVDPAASQTADAAQR